MGRGNVTRPGPAAGRLTPPPRPPTPGNNGGMTDTDTDTDTAGAGAGAGAGTFADLDRYLRLPRLSGLVLSPDGDRLVTTVAELDGDGGRYISSLWSLDPKGDRAARRLTRSEKGESSPVFASDGSLLFVSERSRPGGKDDDPAGIWRLPPEGGEPWPIACRPAGISAVTAAKQAPVVVYAAKVAPGGTDDEAWRKQRSTRKISAILHENLPIRQWDHERGPEEVHFFAGVLPDTDARPNDLAAVRDLTPDAGQALHEATPVLNADGTAVVTEWEVPLPGGRVRVDLVRINHTHLVARAVPHHHRPSCRLGRRMGPACATTRVLPALVPGHLHRRHRHPDADHPRQQRLPLPRQRITSDVD